MTAPLGERLLEAVRYTGAVERHRRNGDYYRIVGDDRLMWAGGSARVARQAVGLNPRCVTTS